MDVPVDMNQLSKPINIISKDSVHKICSGQVILNLATAVKELVENSLDAGATFIEVRLKEYGSEIVEVIDNGSGVEESNMEGLTLKHHTSKLQEFEGLTSVETFGFRGEALSSLCALSDLTVVTRHKTADCGTKLQFDYKGHIKLKQPCARQVGTTVMLQNLFSPLPVRRKEFHRNLQREFAKMMQLLYAYCLVSTGVKITCSNVTKKGSRKVVVSTQGSSSVQENIACVFGAKQNQSLLQVVQKLPSETMLQEYAFSSALNENLFELEGYVSSCDHGSGRSATDRQFFYINSRPCEPTRVVKMVNEVYHQFNQNQYPFVFLNIKTARDEVDVNVTPDKRQIFLENEKALVLIIKLEADNIFGMWSEVVVDLVVDSSCLCQASLLHLYESIPSTMKYQNVSLSTPSPPVTTARGDLSAMFRRWSKSPADAQTPVFAQGVKMKRASSGEDDSRSKKVLCLTNFFTRTPKLSVNTASEEDRDKSNTGVPVSVEEDTVRVESATLTGNRTATADGVEVVPVDENDGMTAPACVNLPVEVSPSTSELSAITDTDNSAVDTNNCLSAGRANLLADVIVSENELSHFTESKSVTTSNIRQANLNCASELSQVIERKTVTVPDTSIGLNGKSELSQVPDNETVTVPDRCASVDDEREVLQIEATAVIDNIAPVVTITDSECNIAIEEHHGTTLEVTMDDIRERISQLRERQQQNQKEGDEVKVKFRAEINPSKNKIAEQELSKEITKDMFAKMEILGQFNLGFIITKLGPDLFIIDQHATDEKYNFEILQRDTVIQNQKLVIPQILELTAANEGILIENEEIFRRNGFDFTVDETGEPMKRVKLQAIPVSRNWHFGKEDIDELIFMLQDSPHTMCRPSRVRAMFASRACRKSVMIGTALSKSDMRRLVDHMGELEQPWNCPHGRPTMRHLVNLDRLRLGDRPQFA